MRKELGRLAALVDPREPHSALAGLKVLVISIKPSLQRGPSARDEIERQIGALNDLGVELVFPSQGDRILF